MSTATIWQTAPDQLAISTGNLHVWRCNNGECNSPQQSSILSTDEIARAKRLLDPVKQQQFINTRMQLRNLLGSYLCIPANEVSFKYNNYGKPALAQQHNMPIKFNLSHSGSWAVIAISYDCAVGVDIEKINAELDYLQLANHYFSLAERNQLLKVTGDEQRYEFYRLWTQKEAVMKMIGTGFSNPEKNYLDNSPLNRPWIKNLPVTGGYSATVVAAKELSIRYYEMDFVSN